MSLFLRPLKRGLLCGVSLSTSNMTKVRKHLLYAMGWYYLICE